MKVGQPVFVCLYVCPSVQAFLALEPERLDRSGRGNIRSMRRNGGKTMKQVTDRSVASDMARAITQTLTEKTLARAAGQTNRQIRLKLGVPIATMGGLNPLG